MNVFHVVEHFSMHAGQIILLTKQIAGGDLAFYEFDEGVPRYNWRKRVFSFLFSVFGKRFIPQAEN